MNRARPKLRQVRGEVKSFNAHHHQICSMAVHIQEDAIL